MTTPLLAPQPRRPSTSTHATFTLLPLVGVRAEEEATPKKLVIPPAAVYVTLRLPLLEESDYPGYEATLLTDEGAPLKVWSGLRRRGGLTTLHTYPFEVVAR